MKAFQLNYEYFNGTSDISFNIALTTVPPEHFSKRLKLKSISEIASDNVIMPPYIINYNNETNETEPPSKASFARDHYGFFNSKLGKSHLIPNFNGVNCNGFVIGNMDDSRNVNPNTSNLFNIKSIKYPTGGRTDFEFESNTFDLLNSGSNLANEGTTIPRLESKSYNGNVYNLEQPIAADIPLKLMNLTDLALTAGNATAPVTMSVFFLYSGGPRPICNESMAQGNLTVTLCREDGTPVTSNINPYYNIGTFANCEGVSGNYIGIKFQNTYQLPPAKYYLKVFIHESVNFISNISIGLNYIAYKQATVFNDEGVLLHSADYGGGLRIKKIINFNQLDQQTSSRSFDYTFVDETGKLRSSGRRMIKPNYSYFEESNGSCGGGGYFYKLMRTSESFMPLNAYTGSIVGYDKITVSEGDNATNGKTEYYFTNSSGLPLTYIDGCTPMYTIIPSGLPDLPYWLQYYESPLGNSKTKTAQFAILPITNNGNLVKTIHFKKINSGYQKIKSEENIYSNFYLGQDIYYWAVQQTPRFISDALGNVNRLSSWGLASYRKNYPALILSRYEITQKINILYDSNDDTKFVKTTHNFEFDNYTHNQLFKQETNNSEGKLLKTIYRYPHDFIAPLGSTPNVYNLMVEKNIIAPIVEQVSTKYNWNTDVTLTLERTKINYFDFGNNIIAPKTVENSFKGSPLETVVNYNIYDAKGNINEQQKVNDVKQVYLYGYDKTYPVAQVIGSDFSKVSSFVKQAILDSPTTTEDQMRFELNKIREGLASTKAMVTTMTYKPLIGMTSQTDHRGITTYYEYDSFGRLKYIKDKNLNVLKVMDYKYQQAITQ
jgi:hypothetical protein